VVTFFDDSAFFHDDDSVRGFDGGQPVRDQNARGLCQDQAQRLLDLPFEVIFRKSYFALCSGRKVSITSI